MGSVPWWMLLGHDDAEEKKLKLEEATRTLVIITYSNVVIMVMHIMIGDEILVSENEMDK